MPKFFRTKLSKGVIILLIVGQFGFVGVALLLPNPEPAQACQVFGNGAQCTLLDFYQAVEKIVTGVLVGIATNFANKYLTKFVAKLQDKYRIKDYLYYDQYLTNYYISNKILKEVKDPNLRRAYSLMLGVTVTGQTQGYTGSDPKQALIPQLKLAIAQAYKDQGGVDPSQIYSPKPTTYKSASQYFSAAQSYFSNPPSYTEQNLRAQFGAFQSAATTASQAEILAGNGLKAGRIIGGTCKKSTILEPTPTPSTPAPSGGGLDYNLEPSSFSYLLDSAGLIHFAKAQTPGTALPPEAPPPGTPPPLSSTPIGSTPIGGTTTLPAFPNKNFPSLQSATDPVGCAAIGGEWQASALDQARSFITNPTGFVDKYIDKAMAQIFGNNYDAKNIFTQIGLSLGNFIFTQLDLNSSASGGSGATSGTFNELPGSQSTLTNGISDNAKLVDIDKDGIPDGEDRGQNPLLDDGSPNPKADEPDGKLTTKDVDICYHGGVAGVLAGCAQSSKVEGSAYFYPMCKSADEAIDSLTTFHQFLEDHKYQNKNVTDFYYDADAQDWATRGAETNGKVEALIDAVKGSHDLNFDKPNPYQYGGGGFGSVTLDPGSSFDNVAFVINRYSVWLAENVRSLFADSDTDLQRGFGSGGGGFYNLRIRTQKILDYIIDFRKVIGKCDSPNSKAANNLPDPIDYTYDNGDWEAHDIASPIDIYSKHPDRKDFVQGIKDQLVAAGEDLSGDCGAFLITQHVAWELRGEGAGLLRKTVEKESCTAGNPSENLSSHYIIYQDGYLYNILGSPGTTNDPQWNGDGCGTGGICPDRWAAPIDPSL